MKRRDWLEEKVRQEFIDSFKEKCKGCGQWKILKSEALCDECRGKYPDDEDCVLI